MNEDKIFLGRRKAAPAQGRSGFFDSFREGERSEQNIAQHAEAIFQCSKTTKQISVSDFTYINQLLDCVVTNSDFVAEVLVL